ncbi:methyl-accepting chemotaxis protein [Acetobacterium bakii]|uniref:methyl-accepting chemotaxis protein n=1 Tax=Acetobacterium bakii TaxID=52689 RepID=UPI00068258FF|nr:methyl-accepting chemotaxis protein [Acetobacterium bakii]
MKWIYNMKMRTKILWGFLTIAFIMAVVGVLGIIKISALRDSDQELYEHITVPIAQFGQIETAFLRIRVDTTYLILSNDEQNFKLHSDKIAQRKAEIAGLTTEFEKSIISDDMRTLFEDYVNKHKLFTEELDTVMQLAIQNQDAQATALMSETGTVGLASRAEQEVIAKIVSMKLEEGQIMSAGNQQEAAGIITTMIVVIVLGLLVSIALGLFLSSMISNPLKKAAHMMKEMSMGHFGLRLNMDTKDEIGEMALAMDSFADEIQNVVIGTMNQISQGDVTANVEAKDDQDEITPALEQIIETIRALITETNMLSVAAVAGQLDSRGNADAFNGGYKEIIEGFNKTLDAVVVPINVAADYVERIGKGVIPPKITDPYNGLFNTLKNNFNACIDGLGALKEGNRILGQMSRNDYSEKIEADYLGIYADIAHAINDVHLRITHTIEIATHIANGNMCDLEVLKKVGKRSDNDTLIPSLIEMIENIARLVTETESMASTAVDGDLGSRGDTSRFPGDFAKVIAGFNDTLDAVIAPIQEASDTLTQLSNGNLHVSMDGNYNGDHAQIKNALNETIDFLRRYVDEITGTLEAIGQGNLDQEITTTYLGDFLPIKTALNDITTILSNTMTDIDIAAAQVEVGAQQISDGGQALAQGTTEQASSIEELSASIEEVAGETKRNAMNANQANELTLKVRTNAVDGNDQMQHMIAAMGEINASSNSISKIIKVIDDIAFQTNILALNAAVEAARAGQHGKGFAVVAEEVRSLAARSAEAVKQTTELIEGSIDKVEAGTIIADNTGQSLNQMLTEIEKVANLVGNIAQASNDQATEIAEITQGIEQVSQVVQTNSATAEESAAASEELSGQAELLKEMVGAFKIKGTPQKAMKISAVSKSVKQNSNPPSEPKIVLDDMDKY